MRDSTLRSAVVLFVTLFLVFAALPVSAQDSDETESEASKQASLNSAFDTGFDLIILRPLGVVALAGGAGLFVPAVIFTAPGGSEGVNDSVDIFLTTPWRDLVDRPLGDI